MCSRVGMMALRCLCRLLLRALPKMSAFWQSLLKPSQRDGGVLRPPLVEDAIEGTESPELPVEILVDILALLEIPDLVRAGSICSSWHAAYTSLHSLGIYRRPQTPCLFYTSESDDDNVACLYSLAEKKVYKLTLPEPPIRSRYMIGSSNGWLVTADDRSELHIVNPITGEQIALPSVTTIEHVKPIFDNAGAIQKYEFSQYYGEEEFNDPIIYALDNLRDELYVKAFVFSDSSTGSYIVVLIHNPHFQLSFAKEGDSKWTWLPPSAADYEDCIYVDGILYALTSTGRIDAFDLTCPTISRKEVMGHKKDYIYEHLYLAQTPTGDLLQVWREQDIAVGGDGGEDAPKRDPSDIISETRGIMLYKVDMAAKELVQNNNLHDLVLFLGHSQSQCISAKEYPQLKANHVYLTDDEHGIALCKSNKRDMGVFNLADNVTEEIVPQQFWSSWPAPIWITLNLTKLSLGWNK